jgi:hypothetical protein
MQVALNTSSRDSLQANTKLSEALKRINDIELESAANRSDMLQQKRESDKAASDFKDLNANLLAENTNLKNKLQSTVRYVQ